MTGNQPVVKLDCLALAHAPCENCGGWHPPVMPCGDGPCCDGDQKARQHSIDYVEPSLGPWLLEKHENGHTIRMATDTPEAHQTHNVVTYDHGVSEAMWGGNDLQYAQACMNARVLAYSREMWEALWAIIQGDHLSAEEALAMGMAVLKKVDRKDD